MKNSGVINEDDGVALAISLRRRAEPISETCRTKDRVADTSPRVKELVKASYKILTSFCSSEPLGAKHGSAVSQKKYIQAIRT